MSLKFKIIVAVLLSFAMTKVVGGLVYVSTESIDKKLLYVDIFDKPIHKGDYVKYEIVSDVIGTKSITKKISCFEGDFLELKKRSFYCNGVFLGEAMKVSSTGRSLRMSINESMVIDKGYSFISGTHERSYDSRYFGLVKNSDLVRLLPIF